MAPVVFRRRALLALSGTLAALALPPASRAQAPIPDEASAERRVKAAYLYRFAGYTEWPAGVLGSAEAPLRIGVWGSPDLADDLDTLVHGRQVQGHPVQVRAVDSAAATAGLHLLFLAHAASGRLADLQAALGARPVLLVTESPGALRRGSVINFLVDDGQVRFELSLEAAQARDLRLSSRLIAVSHNLSGRAR